MPGTSDFIIALLRYKSHTIRLFFFMKLFLKCIISGFSVQVVSIAQPVPLSNFILFSWSMKRILYLLAVIHLLLTLQSLKTTNLLSVSIEFLRYSNGFPSKPEMTHLVRIQSISYCYCLLIETREQGWGVVGILSWFWKKSHWS